MTEIHQMEMGVKVIEFLLKLILCALEVLQHRRIHDPNVAKDSIQTYLTQHNVSQNVVMV